MVIVKLESGYISGTAIGDIGKEIYIYRGIPYAAPPVGNLRWKPPQPAIPWSGIRECTDFGNAGPQDWENPFAIFPCSISEDCLYLNVLTPAKTANEKLPVMVWFHGGGYEIGSGNDPTFNFPFLPQHGIVLVTVTERLDVMGLMAHPLLSREQGGHSGNYMFLDLIAALKWVRKNIDSFGGDPNNITIAGESGGGGKVLGLMASPLAKGLFQKSIVESGTLMGSMSLSDSEAWGENFFAKLGIEKTSDPLAAARALDWKAVQRAYIDLKVKNNIPISVFTTAVDGWFVLEDPNQFITDGKHCGVHMIMGSNYGELILPSKYFGPQLVPEMVRLLSGNNKAGGKSYAYICHLLPAGWRELGGLCGHTSELPYVFGDLDFDGEWPGHTLFDFGEQPPAGVTKDPGVTNTDRKDSDKVMTIWAQFMKNGDPSVPNVVNWPAWNITTDQYLDIGYPFQAKSGFSRVAQH